MKIRNLLQISLLFPPSHTGQRQTTTVLRFVLKPSGCARPHDIHRRVPLVACLMLCEHTSSLRSEAGPS